jgi:hypothetical protein
MWHIAAMPEQLKHEMRVLTHGGKIKREIPAHLYIYLSV